MSASVGPLSATELAARRLQQAWENDRDDRDDDGYEWDSLDTETQEWYRTQATAVLDAAEWPALVASLRSVTSERDQLRAALSGLMDACELWAGEDRFGPHLPRRVAAALIPAKVAVGSAEFPEVGDGGK